MPPVVKARPAAFTLIELLVVVFIIGILIAATLTIVPKVRQKVYETETQAQLSAISNAIQQYYNDFRAYPGPLPNNQLCYGIDSTASPTISYAPTIADPVSPSNPVLPLTPITTLASPPFLNTNYIPNTATMNAYYITGSQNLVLGLLGGLEIATTNGVAPFSFVYNAQDIFSDGITPSPRGAASLNYTNPKRQQAYIQVKSGDLSVPSRAYNGGQGAGFQDEAGRTTMTKSSSSAMQPTGAPYPEAMIPVFLDKYSSPLPILYYRTNPGGTAIVGFRNLSAPSTGAPLNDQALAALGNTTAEIAQYDLNQNLPYTASAIGTVGSNPNSYHGLVGLTSQGNMTNQYLVADDPSSPPSTPTDLIDYPSGGKYIPTNQGANAIAYFKDPTLNTATFATLSTKSPANTHLGVARQKDGYLLISAGPDRLYGTHDDTIHPGPLQP